MFHLNNNCKYVFRIILQSHSNSANFLFVHLRSNFFFIFAEKKTTKKKRYCFLISCFVYVLLIIQKKDMQSLFLQIYLTYLEQKLNDYCRYFAFFCWIEVKGILNNN